MRLRDMRGTKARLCKEQRGTGQSVLSLPPRGCKGSAGAGAAAYGQIWGRLRERSSWKGGHGWPALTESTTQGTVPGLGNGRGGGKFRPFVSMHSPHTGVPLTLVVWGLGDPIYNLLAITEQEKGQAIRA